MEEILKESSGLVEDAWAFTSQFLRIQNERNGGSNGSLVEFLKNTNEVKIFDFRFFEKEINASKLYDSSEYFFKHFKFPLCRKKIFQEYEREIDKFSFHIHRGALCELMLEDDFGIRSKKVFESFTSYFGKLNVKYDSRAPEERNFFSDDEERLARIHEIHRIYQIRNDEELNNLLKESNSVCVNGLTFIKHVIEENPNNDCVRTSVGEINWNRFETGLSRISEKVGKKRTSQERQGQNNGEEEEEEPQRKKVKYDHKEIQARPNYSHFSSHVKPDDLASSSSRQGGTSFIQPPPPPASKKRILNFDRPVRSETPDGKTWSMQPPKLPPLGNFGNRNNNNNNNNIRRKRRKKVMKILQLYEDGDSNNNRKLRTISNLFKVEDENCLVVMTDEEFFAIQLSRSTGELIPRSLPPSERRNDPKIVKHTGFNDDEGNIGASVGIGRSVRFDFDGIEPVISNTRRSFLLIGDEGKFLEKVIRVFIVAPKSSSSLLEDSDSDSDLDDDEDDDEEEGLEKGLGVVNKANFKLQWKSEHNFPTIRLLPQNRNAFIFFFPTGGIQFHTFHPERVQHQLQCLRQGRIEFNKDSYGEILKTYVFPARPKMTSQNVDEGKMEITTRNQVVVLTNKGKMAIYEVVTKLFKSTGRRGRIGDDEDEDDDEEEEDEEFGGKNFFLENSRYPKIIENYFIENIGMRPNNNNESNKLIRERRKHSAVYNFGYRVYVVTYRSNMMYFSYVDEREKKRRDGFFSANIIGVGKTKNIPRSSTTQQREEFGFLVLLENGIIEKCVLDEKRNRIQKIEKERIMIEKEYQKKMSTSDRLVVRGFVTNPIDRYSTDIFIATGKGEIIHYVDTV